MACGARRSACGPRPCSPTHAHRLGASANASLPPHMVPGLLCAAGLALLPCVPFLGDGHVTVRRPARGSLAGEPVHPVHPLPPAEPSQGSPHLLALASCANPVSTTWCMCRGAHVPRWRANSRLHMPLQARGRASGCRCARAWRTVRLLWFLVARLFVHVRSSSVVSQTSDCLCFHCDGSGVYTPNERLRISKSRWRHARGRRMVAKMRFFNTRSEARYINVVSALRGNATSPISRVLSPCLTITTFVTLNESICDTMASRWRHTVQHT